MLAIITLILSGMLVVILILMSLLIMSKKSQEVKFCMKCGMDITNKKIHRCIKIIAIDPGNKGGVLFLKSGKGFVE